MSKKYKLFRQNFIQLDPDEFVWCEDSIDELDSADILETIFSVGRDFAYLGTAPANYFIVEYDDDVPGPCLWQYCWYVPVPVKHPNKNSNLYYEAESPDVHDWTFLWIETGDDNC